MFEERRLNSKMRKFFVLGSMLYLGVAFMGDNRIERVDMRRGDDGKIITTLDGFREIQDYFVEEGSERGNYACSER